MTLHPRFVVHARPAWRAWTRGDIDDVARLAQLAPPAQRDFLMFLSNYVRGRYEDAMAHHSTSLSTLDTLVVQALLHLNRPGEALDFVARHRGRYGVPIEMVMRADHPLRVTIDETMTLPFVDHPLAPLVGLRASVNGQELTVHVDTGATFLVMGTHRAAALGISLVAGGRGYHGATRTRRHFGVAKQLRLGSAALTNVPVETLPTLQGSQDVIVIGTNVLQQFLTTIDTPRQRLVLSPRGDRAKAEQHRALLGGDRPVARIPFYLWGGHYMFARGGFGRRRDLNFFLDSGLAYVIEGDGGPPRRACLYASGRRCRSWGVPRHLAAGPHFGSVESVFLGPVEQRDPFVAVLARRHAPWDSFGGVRIDGGLSQAFLGNHSWTIDFDRHEYSFG